MTKSLTINFNLTIWARVISISHPIKLVYDRNQYSLPSKNNLVEEFIQINDQVQLRSRKYGYLHLLDESKNGEKSNTNCTDDQVNFIITQWYDPTTLNMMYLCSTALMKYGVKSKRINVVIDFIVRLYNEKAKIKDDVLYVNAQKFVRLQMKDEKTKFRQVPDLPYWGLEIGQKKMDEKWSKYFGMLTMQSENLDTIKKDMLRINSKANELENVMMEELEKEKEYIFNLMETMNMSWISYERYVFPLLEAALE